MPSSFRCDNVDYAAYSIRTETYWNHAAINLYAFGKINRDVVQSERAAHTFLGCSVDEYLDVFAAEAVHRHCHIRADPAVFPYFQARCFLQCVTQCLGGVLCADSNSIICRVFDFVYRVPYNSYLSQLGYRSKFDIESGFLPRHYLGEMLLFFKSH